MNSIHSFFVHSFLDLFIHSSVHSFSKHMLDTLLGIYLIHAEKLNKWISISVILHCQIQVRKMELLTYKEYKMFFFSFCISIAPNSWEPTDVEKFTQSLCYVPGGTLGTIYSKMDEGWSLGSSWFCIFLSSRSLLVALLHCSLTSAWNIAELTTGKHTDLPLVGWDSSAAGRPQGCNLLYSFNLDFLVFLLFQDHL